MPPASKIYDPVLERENSKRIPCSGVTTPVLYCIVLYCIVLYCIVLYYIVLCCIVMYCIVMYCIVLETKIMFMLYLFDEMILPFHLFHFSSAMFVQKIFEFSVISLSYEIQCFSKLTTFYHCG